MTGTYCGKNCAECTQKEILNCCGCKDGPGSMFGGDCIIAKCARDKGHETCETCGFKDNCSTLRNCAHMPDSRIEKIEAEEKRKAVIAQQAPILGKWLWIMFWLIIPSTMGGLMAGKTSVNTLPGLYFAGQIIAAICLIAYGVILIKLSSEETRYKIAGICGMIAWAILRFWQE